MEEAQSRALGGSPEIASAFYRAKRAGRCKFCGMPIAKGNPLFPVQLSGAGKLSTLTTPLPTSPLQAALPPADGHVGDSGSAAAKEGESTTPAQLWRSMAASAARVEWVHVSCAMRLQGLLPPLPPASTPQEPQVGAGAQS